MDALEQKAPDSDSNTSLLPKSFFGGKDLEVGKTCKVRITHVYEDEVEVEYVSDEKKEEASEVDSKIDAMAESEGYDTR